MFLTCVGGCLVTCIWNGKCSEPDGIDCILFGAERIQLKDVCFDGNVELWRGRDGGKVTPPGLRCTGMLK